MGRVNDARPADAGLPRKLRWHEHVWSGLSFLIVVFGGAVGGLCGGLAYYVNVQIFRRLEPRALRYPAAFLVNLFAVALYFLIVNLLVQVFPALGRRR